MFNIRKNKIPKGFKTIEDFVIKNLSYDKVPKFDGRTKKFIRQPEVLKVIYKINPPYIASCCKCGLPWNWCEPRSVTYKSDETSSSGVFQVCEDCWKIINLDELIICYTNYYYNIVHGEFEVTLDELLECVCREYYESFKFNNKI